MAGVSRTVKVVKKKPRAPRRTGLWDASLEGTVCPGCNGTGSMYEVGDAHRSAGSIPCKRGYFAGHGEPTCHKGKLRFSDYDKKNWPKNKKRVA